MKPPWLRDGKGLSSPCRDQATPRVAGDRLRRATYRVWTNFVKRVTPLRHLVGMEQTMSVILIVLAGLAAALFVAAGLFSLVALWRGDLWESDRRIDRPAAR